MFGLNPTLILGSILAFILATGGAYVAGDLSGHKAANKTWESKIAKQEADANALLAQETAKSAAKDQAYAELANRLDTQHNEALAEIDATRDDFAERLRIAASRVGRCSAPTTKAVDPSVNKGTPAEGGLREVDLRSGEVLREYVGKLEVYSSACHEWAIQVGR